MTRLIDADELKNKFWHGDLVPHKEMYHISEIKFAIDTVPTVEERPQGEQKDIDIPKMCEECHSQSYNNGFDAGYELGKKDAQKHITELNERIEFLMQQIRLWQSWASTEQQGKDCEENMNEQETFIDEERPQKTELEERVKELENKVEMLIRVIAHM